MGLKTTARSSSERAVLGKRASNCSKVCYVLDERAVWQTARSLVEQFFADQFKKILKKTARSSKLRRLLARQAETARSTSKPK